MTPQLFDPIRKRWVANTPEEQIRQSVINWLVGLGGYSANQLAVERLIPLGPGSSRIQRRFDIAIYLSGASGVLTLSALIECKAGELSQIALQKAQRQVMGYQWHCQPLIIIVAAQNGSWHCLTSEPQVWKPGIPCAHEVKQLIP